MTVADEKSRCLIPGEGLGDPLGRPFGRWVRGDGEVNELPPIVAQDDEHEEELEGERWHDQEVDRGGAVHVVAEECLPSLIRIGRASRHVLGDGRSTDLEAELEEFSLGSAGHPIVGSGRSSGG